MKRRLNLRKKANKYKAEADALRKEVDRLKEKIQEVDRDRLRFMECIALNARFDWESLGMFENRKIPEFIIRFRLMQQPEDIGAHCDMYSLRLYFPQYGERLVRPAADFVMGMVGRIMSLWLRGVHEKKYEVRE